MPRLVTHCSECAARFHVHPGQHRSIQAVLRQPGIRSCALRTVCGICECIHWIRICISSRWLVREEVHRVEARARTGFLRTTCVTRPKNEAFRRVHGFPCRRLAQRPCHLLQGRILDGGHPKPFCPRCTQHSRTQGPKLEVELLPTKRRRQLGRHHTASLRIQRFHPLGVPCSLGHCQQPCVFQRPTWRIWKHGPLALCLEWVNL